MLISGKSFTVMLATLLTAATLALLYLPTIGQAEESTTEATESTEKANPPRDESTNADQTESSDKARIAGFEKALQEKISLIVVMFNDSRGYYRHLRRTYERLAREGKTIYLFGMEIDPASNEAKRYGIGPTPTLIIFRDGKETARLEKIENAEQLNEFVAATLGRGDKPKGKFPSLEDQKLADLAWKRLQLELEPIGIDDLKRVQALGYDGGLTIVGAPSGMGSNGILVGLHVWPTTSLADVAEVLNRDDLAELSPLKYYIVDQNLQTGEDVVRTGRISVDVEPRQQGTQRRGRMPGSLPTAPPMNPYSAPPTPLPFGEPVQPADAKKSALRYDGKTFDQWRAAWQTELSTEKRLEAVKALAAFGANGYGQEAAEEILNVAAEYEFRGIDRTTLEGQLIEAVRTALIEKVPANAWLPLLRKRFEADPQKWQWLAIETLPRSKTVGKAQGEEKRDFLLLLTHSEVGSISYSAIEGLVQFDPTLENDQIERLVMDQLHSNQYNLVLGVINQFTGFAPQYPPEVVELLLHGDERQQTTLRQALKHTVGPWEPLIALSKALIAVLKDNAKTADHLSAIRALAAVGETATRGQTNVRDVLEEIVKKGNLEHQVAAAFAVQEITRGKTQAVPLLDGAAQDAAGEKLSTLEIQTMIEKEREAVFGGSG